MTVPQAADDDRVLLATTTDVALAWGAGFASGAALAPDGLGLPLGYLAAFFGAGLAASFVNHVLGMWLLRASLGKLLFGLRVVRVLDGRRPGFWRSARRWLTGLFFLALMVLTEEGDGVAEAAGLRTVRWRDLRGYGPDGHYRV
ncbi:RDD family protein [Streptomyces sp. DSM 44915]|uniref:RDD family protein n=1 Tax=Streptomyces chisholmiae TaxID=3075540 RepID=A0ABU2JWN2_9ACTN|nr:RDD family protein [Streptomyces sp. DSM 44915]MDT0269416.1 RDD family protein [Streptomyces sp. DSM 44915]